jgi:hypothetical protein
MKTALILAAMLMAGCSTQPRIDIAEIRASCPALSTPKRHDMDAQTRRVAEVEGWYAACRESILGKLDDDLPSASYFPTFASR